MWEQELAALKATEEVTGKGFGDAQNPLLVSCRSGSKESMPGMMDTVLNIGLNDATVEGLAALTDNPRFAYDAYRRLVEGFGKVVLEIPDTAFEHALHTMKDELGITLDTDLKTDDLKKLTAQYKAIVKQHKGFDFPQDPIEQLRLATEAVFKSWNGKRAVDYRRATDIPGTGCFPGGQTTLTHLSRFFLTGLKFRSKEKPDVRELFLGHAQGVG